MGAYQAMETQYDVQYTRFGCEKATGAGAHGEVRPCTHSQSYKLRAVKTIEKVDWSTRRHVLEEIAILRAVSGKHPNIIEFVEYFEEWGVMNLIFEYCSKGTLEQAIGQRRLTPGEGAAAPLAWQLVSALAFLRQAHIVHRDVKPANLLFADEPTLKLADFGTACLVNQGDEGLKVAEGTPAFFAPEVHQLPKGKGYAFPVDVWAAGVTLYMLLFQGAHPFDDRGCVSKQRVLGGDFDVGWLTSRRACDLLEWLLMPHPDQRIGAADALGHPWFASHSLGAGGLAKERPSKLVLDSHGNWLKTNL